MKTYLMLPMLVLSLAVILFSCCEEPECPDVLFTGGTINVGPLKHIQGNTEIGGNNPKIIIDAFSEIDGSRLKISGSVTVQEGGADFTTFSSEFSKSFLVDGLEKEICELDIIEYREGYISTDAKPGLGEKRYEGNGLIDYADVVADTEGNENGELYARIRIRPVSIQFK